MNKTDPKSFINDYLEECCVLFGEPAQIPANEYNKILKNIRKIFEHRGYKIVDYNNISYDSIKKTIRKNVKFSINHDDRLVFCDCEPNRSTNILSLLHELGHLVLQHTNTEDRKPYDENNYEPIYYEEEMIAQILAMMVMKSLGYDYKYCHLLNFYEVAKYYADTLSTDIEKHTNLDSLVNEITIQLE